MGMAVSIELDEKTKHRDMAILATIRDELESEVIQELELVCQKILAEAIALCPVDTGALRSSINMVSGTISAGDFAGFQLFAGDESIINPKTHKSTAEYALLVHDGHAMPDGSFWEGMPFLEQAYAEYADELEEAINRAIKSCSIEPSAGKVAEMSD
jgi:hypothetical protein